MVMSWQGVATTRHGRTKEAQVYNSAGFGLENRLGDGDGLGSVDEIGTGLGDMAKGFWQRNQTNQHPYP